MVCFWYVIVNTLYKCGDDDDDDDDDDKNNNNQILVYISGIQTVPQVRFFSGEVSKHISHNF